MAQAKKTLYQILGVSRDATSVDIGLAYEMRSSELQHATPPDPSGLALVREAHGILTNPQRRAAYDAQLVTATEKAAASEQAGAPDLELEGDDEDKPRKLPVIPIVIGAVVVVAILVVVLRPSKTEAPPPPPAPVVAAPKPPPPKLKTGVEILADASTSSGQLLGYSMSGAAAPVGIALAIEPGTMVTTCHGIPAGAKLVVKVGKESHSAELTITDEDLDLCRLSVPSFTTPPLKVASEEPKAGDKIFAVGVNSKGEFAATEGTIKKALKSPAGNVLEVSMPIAPTGSGGGIFDEQGRLVGIAITPHSYGAGLQIALPTTWIARMRSRAVPTK